LIGCHARRLRFVKTMTIRTSTTTPWRGKSYVGWHRILVIQMRVMFAKKHTHVNNGTVANARGSAYVTVQRRPPGLVKKDESDE
jgi:hypothetical protein